MKRKHLLEIGSAGFLVLVLVTIGALWLRQRQLDERLLLAAQSGDLKAARDSLARGANPNQHGRSGMTPLHWAAGFPSGALVKLLIERGADPNARNGSGDAPLILAATAGHADIAHILLRRGADPNLPGKGGWTPLLYAAANGRLELVRELLQARADVNRSNARGETPVAVCLKGIARNTPHSSISAGERSRLSNRQKPYRAILRLLKQAGVTGVAH